MPIQFPYPQNGWSTGRMRKVADVRRGRPELEEPGIAEAEKLAGASKGLMARGGTVPGGRVEGISGATPVDVLQQHHSQIQEAANSYAQGKMTLTDFNKTVTDLGWSPMKKKKNTDPFQVTDPNGEVHTLTEGK